MYWLFVVLTLLLVALVGGATYRTAKVLPDWPLDSNPLLVPSEFIARLVLLVLCFGLGQLSGLPPQVLGWAWPDPLHQVGWGLFWGAAIAFIYIFLTRRIVSSTGGRYYTPTVVRAIVPKSRRELGLMALSMIGVVVVEEMLFRGLLIGGLTPLLPGWLLVVLTGVIFGLLHSPQGIWGMVAIGAGGMALGWMFLGAQSLLLPLVAHYVANMIQITYAYGRRDEILALNAPTPPSSSRRRKTVR